MGAWVIVFAVMSVGFASFTYVVARGLVADARDYLRMEAPGRAEVKFDHAGKYVIFHEYERTRDSQGIIRPPGIEEMAFLVLPEDGDTPIQVVEVGRSWRYVIRRTVGEAVREFVVPTPGVYEISATSPAGGDIAPLTLSVGRPYTNRIIGAFLAGLIPMAITLAIIAITLFIAHRRAQTREEVMASAP
jgi:hypothetical protein